MSDLIFLRDLPGVRDIEELSWNPENLEPPKAIDSFARINAVSAQLFGIWEEDTFKEDPDAGASPEVLAAWWEWEQHFAPCGYEYEEETIILWNALGWDLTGQDGEELFCAEHFNRQIIAATKGLMPEAKLHLDGTGVRPQHLKSKEDQEFENAVLEDQLKKEAARRGIII